MVASMASAILMAADERVVTSRCWIGLHEVSGAVQGSLTVQEDTTKFYKQLQDQVVDLYTERSNITKRTLSSRWKRKDVYVSSAEALKMGLVDKIEEV
jgi:ATP-dependent protease ClpP protease subunit